MRLNDLVKKQNLSYRKMAELGEFQNFLRISAQTGREPDSSKVGRRQR